MDLFGFSFFEGGGGGGGVVPDIPFVTNIDFQAHKMFKNPCVPSLPHLVKVSMGQSLHAYDTRHALLSLFSLKYRNFGHIDV